MVLLCVELVGGVLSGSNVENVRLSELLELAAPAVILGNEVADVEQGNGRTLVIHAESTSFSTIHEVGKSATGAVNVVSCLLSALAEGHLGQRWENDRLGGRQVRSTCRGCWSGGRRSIAEGLEHGSVELLGEHDIGLEECGEAGLEEFVVVEGLIQKTVLLIELSNLLLSCEVVIDRQVLQE